MAKLFILFAAANGFIAVILGAFGAHALKARLTPELMSAYETGVQYHLWHALALLGVGILASTWPVSKWLVGSGWLFVIGMTFFCGSLYILATTELRHLGFINIGLITPLGGLCLMAGWALLFMAALQYK